MKKVLIAIILVAVLAFGAAGTTSAYELEPTVTPTSITSDPGGGGR